MSKFKICGEPQGFTYLSWLWFVADIMLGNLLKFYDDWAILLFHNHTKILFIM